MGIRPPYKNRAFILKSYLVLFGIVIISQLDENVNENHKKGGYLQKICLSQKKTVRTAAASHLPTVEKDICTQKYYLRVPMFAKMVGIS